jgi:hypothetical protein
MPAASEREPVRPVAVKAPPVAVAAPAAT